MDDKLIVGGREFGSRFFLGTGKFGDKEAMRKAIVSSGSQLVTVALRRIDLDETDENILSFIPDGTTIMVNTSGARNAAEAVRIAHIAREAGYGDWIKIEVISDSRYLLPDNQETIKATRILSGEGFVVLPYMHPDLYVAKALVDAGAAAVMPLGSLIGSNQGLKMRTLIEVLIEEIVEVPIVVDAGIGRPSQAAEAMEMGADAVLANTAVADAEDPPLMAAAFARGVEAGRMAYLAKMGKERKEAAASSPLTGFLYDE
ncbi:MAG: Thiazole synthase [Syntrophorhabdus sp. PtaB.Bin184]|jgi:thiazole synthase|nr:MAG: Thiazole synthase [Syntrophorhabdus sp. PtaB.Bin184]